MLIHIYQFHIYPHECLFIFCIQSGIFNLHNNPHARCDPQPTFHSAKQTATVPPTGEGGVKEGQGLLPSYGRGVRWTRCACLWRTGRPGGPFLTKRHSPTEANPEADTYCSRQPHKRKPAILYGEVTGLMPHPESLVDSAYGSTMKAATGKAVPADWRLVTQGWAGVPLT